MPTISLRETLKRGLRAEPFTRVEQPELSTCLNYRVGSSGLEPFIPPVAFDDWRLKNIFPYPQLFTGKNRNVIVSTTPFQGNDIITVVESPTFAYSDFTTWTDTDTNPANGYVPHYVPIKDIDSLVSVYPTIRGNRFHFIDMPSGYILLNGDYVLVKANFDALFTKYAVPPLMLNNKLYYSATNINTGCYHKGRVLFGGFVLHTNKNNFTNSGQWLFDKSDNWVAWSLIGGGDVLCHLTQNAAVVDADAGSTRESTWQAQLARTNEAGAMPLSSPGAVLRMLPMGNSVICYTETGVHILTVASTPAPTYGETLLKRIPVYSRESIAGDEKQQWFLDNTGVLWTITEGNISRLGYQEYFLSLVQDGQELLFSYDISRGDLYISSYEPAGGDVKTFLLTANGMSTVSIPVWSLAYSDGATICTPYTPDPADTTNGVIQFTPTTTQFTNTTFTNLGTNKNKTVRWLEADVYPPTNSALMLGVTAQKDVDSGTSIAQGYAYNGQTAVVKSGHLFSIYSSTTADHYLDDIKVSYDSEVTFI